MHNLILCIVFLFKANRAANSLLVIAIEPKIAGNCDDLLLRSRAAELLSKVSVKTFKFYPTQFKIYF